MVGHSIALLVGLNIQSQAYNGNFAIATDRSRKKGIVQYILESDLDQGWATFLPLSHREGVVIYNLTVRSFRWVMRDLGYSLCTQKYLSIFTQSGTFSLGEMHCSYLFSESDSKGIKCQVFHIPEKCPYHWVIGSEWQCVEGWVQIR